MKDIKELTEDETRQILEFVYPNNKDNFLKKISFEPKITEEGYQQITLGGRDIIGIEYHNGQDNCILHFNNTRVVLWLYKNGYDITDLLESNAYMSEMENDFSDAMFEVSWLSEGEAVFSPEVIQNWTLDYVKRRCTEIYNKYFMKDYN